MNPNQNDDIIWKMYDERMSIEPEAGQERYNPGRFKRENQVFRVSHFATRIVTLNKDTELPTNSILHLLDDAAYEEHSDTPRVDDNEFIAHEHFRKYIYHVKGFNLNEPITYNDKFIYRVAGLPKSLMAFRAEQGSNFRYFNEIEQIPNQRESLIVVNHNPLFRAKILGRLRFFRKTELILASILNTVHQFCGMGKQQFIQIPWGDEIYPKSQFLRSRNELSLTTVRHPDSWQYLMMMHLVNFMWDSATTSFFKQIPEEDLAQINLILDNKKHYIFYNLKDLVDLNKKNIAYYKFVNQLNLLALTGRSENAVKDAFDVVEEKSQEADDSSTTVYTPKITDSLTTADEDRTEDESYPLAASNIVGVSSKSLSTKMVEKFIDKVAEATPKTTNLAVTQIDQHPSRVINQVSLVKNAAGKPIMKVTSQKNNPVSQQKLAEENIVDIDTDHFTSEFIKLQDAAAEEFIQKREDLTPKQKERYKKLSQKYKEVTLNGTPLTKLLTKPQDLTLSNADITEKEIGLNLLDKSALSSSISSFDRSYMEKSYDKHMAGVLTSFQRNGVFLQDIKTEKVITEMNNYTKYVATYEDVNGKRSSVKFRIPTVDRDGRILVDGVKQVLKKQRINLPIAKIDDDTVSLSSNYNKTQVLRKYSKAHSYLGFIETQLSSEKSNAILEYGNFKLTDIPLSYEYVSIAGKFMQIDFTKDNVNWSCWFDYKTRLKHFDGDVKLLTKLENEYGTYFARNDTDYFFVDNENVVGAVRKNGGEDIDNEFTCIWDILRLSLKESTKVNPLTEWTTIKVLDKDFPVIFLLAYKFGLRNILDYLKVSYVITERQRKTIIGGNDSTSTEGTESFGNEKYVAKPGDIAIKFADKVLHFNRYPLTKSLIVSGLAYYDLEHYEFAEFESPDIYYQVLMDNKWSINYLKGIDDLFDLFVDNMTYNVLRSMHEPTNFKDLLIRATVLLSTCDHRQASSRLNHRIRGYEQFNAILYNEMARQFAVYRNSRSRASSFSINPEAIYLRIIQNQSLLPSEMGNPIQDLKERASMTYAGIGGRTSESFVVEDRKFAKDDIGIISEATVDNGKVGINAQLSFNPAIANIDGVLAPEDPDDVTPSQALSITTLTFPFATQDDTKRMNMLNIQSSHMVPVVTTSMNRVRTGYERVFSHRCAKDFAGTAEKNGKITNIDTKTKLLEVTYDDGTQDVYPIGEHYTPFNGFEVTQDIRVVVSLGQKVKKGDLLTYNAGFFTYDPIAKQADLSTGVMANVAFIEVDTNLEDATEISQELADRMSMKPTQIRDVSLAANSIIYDIVKVGDTVNQTDKLMTFEEDPEVGGNTASSFNVDEDTLALLGDLNRKIPTAKFSGKIVKIEARYGGDISEMHPTLQAVVRECIAPMNKAAKLAGKTVSAEAYPSSAPLPTGSRVRGTEFDKKTVMLTFHIQELEHTTVGDKLVVANQLKNTIASVMSHPIYTGDGKPIDVLFSNSGCSRRIVLSAQLNGVMSRCMHKLEDNILDMYFDDNK